MLIICLTSNWSIHVYPIMFMEVLQLWRHANLALVTSSFLSKPSWTNNWLCFCLLVCIIFFVFFLYFFFFFLYGDCTSSSFCSAPRDPETSMSSLGIMSFRRLLTHLSGLSICGLTVFLYEYFECSSSSLLFFVASSTSYHLFYWASSVFFCLSSALISSSLHSWAAWSSSFFSFFRFASSICCCVLLDGMMQWFFLVLFYFYQISLIFLLWCSF